MIAYARKAVRCGMLVVKSGDTPELVDNYLKAAKSIFDTAKDPLPPEYPENGDWRKTWKGDALEYIKDCINEAREILEYYRDRPAAKQSLDNANDYASYFGMALPPEYEDVRKLVGTVEQRSDGRLGKFFENIPGSAERAEKVYHIKVKNMREIIGDITTSGKLDDENIERAVVYLRNIKVTCKVYDQPMPPEFYKLKKLVNWKDPDEEPPAKLKTYDKHYYEDESKSLEELKEQKSGRRKESPYKYDSSEFEKAMDDMEGPLLRDIINEIKAGHADKPGLQTMRNNLNKIKKNREASEKTLSPEFYELDRLLTEMEGNAGTGSEDRYIELCIKDVKKYLHEKDGVWMAKTSLESAKTYAKSLGLPLPPEYDEAVKYVQEVERAAEPMRAGTKETRKIPLGPERTINQEEAYGLRKELEGSGNPKHAKAVEELRKGHYATAALLINTAEELDNAHVPSETLEPLYEEAVRDLLNGALAFENDPLILRSMLEDVKKYVSKVKELPEDLAALYEFLRKKAGC
jgi:hypothetical protein